MSSNEEMTQEVSGGHRGGDGSPNSTTVNDGGSGTHLRHSEAHNPSDAQKPSDAQELGDARKTSDTQKKGSDTLKPSDAQKSSDAQESSDAQKKLRDEKCDNGVGEEGRDALATLAGSADGERCGGVEGVETEKNELSGGGEQKDAKRDDGVIKDADKAGDGGHDRKELISADGTAVADTDEPPHARASRESSSSVSEEDPDMNEDLDKPWAKPSLEHALQARKRAIWKHGLRSYFGTTVKDIGSMGVGIYLYFWMARIVAIAFLLCGLASLPSLLLNSEGNAGMAIPETDVDPLRLVSLSYGNQGLNPSLVAESGCISSNGTVDCTGDTVQARGCLYYFITNGCVSIASSAKRSPKKVFGEAKDALHVGYILVGVEIVIAISFAIFIIILADKLEEKIEEIDDSNVSPANYAVMVRGLPIDVTKEEVRDHFHSRYSLTVPDPSYPLLGVSTTGVAIFWASTLGVATGLLVTPSVVARTGVERHLVAAAIGPGCFFISVLSVFAVSKVCGVGEPRKRDTLQEKWEEGMKRRRRQEALHNKKKAPKALKNPTGPTVVPLEHDAEVIAAVEQDQDAPGMLEAGGISAAHLDGTSAEGCPPDPVPCQSCLNTHDKSFLGSWVADVVLGNPVGDVLQGFMEQEEAFVKIRKARAVVRQMKTLGKARKLAKAEAKLAKLKTKEEALMAATKKKQDPAKLDIVSVAFVTFEHEESKRRCLEDYRYSQSTFARYFQPTRLQFSRPFEPDAEGEGTKPSRCGRSNSKKPLAQRWRLKVFQAPEPSDVKWENLDVTPISRKLRRAVTSFVCTVLLIVSFAIIYLAENEQETLAQQIPTADTCDESIPAVIFGTYDFPLDAELMRDETRDPTCPEGTFYLSYVINSSDRDSETTTLNYTSLPRVYSADGASVSRAEFELENGASSLCDDPCSPTTGGMTCRALSCFEKSWRSEGFDCATYLQSTTVGCFCIDAVVTSLKNNGLIAGARVVANEQGALCAPFLKDYAEANALKLLAVFSVVIVNTLLTSVMDKLAKFERHVSLSDYSSTFTAKLALGQFLNTALVVIIVNASYTGGGLGFLQDMGILGGDYKDFERAWYATVGVAVAMTMLFNVGVPHVGPLMKELIIKRILRFIKRRSVATQKELDDLYKPPKFSIESRCAFLLQVLGVSMLYSGGIPILYVFAAFSFATNFVVDKLWIIKLTQQPPMYTEALARMFVRVMPLALLAHMALTCYMLGNSDILNIGFISLEAEAIATDLQGKGLWGLVADHALRKHVFALFVLTIVFFALYVAYKIVGDPFLKLVKIVFGTLFRYLFWNILRYLLRQICGKTLQKPVTAKLHQNPGFTDEYFRVLAPGETIKANEKEMGWVMTEDGKKAKWLFTDDGLGPRGVKARKGFPRQTWQAIAELGQYNYVMEESDACGLAARYMATAGFVSPRMKEKATIRKAKTERAAVKAEADRARAAQEAGKSVAAGDAGAPAAALCAAATLHPPGPSPQERRDATADDGDGKGPGRTVSSSVDQAYSAPDGQKRDDGAPAREADAKVDNDGKGPGVVPEEHAPSAPDGDDKLDNKTTCMPAEVALLKEGDNSGRAPGAASVDQAFNPPGADGRDARRPGRAKEEEDVVLSTSMEEKNPLVLRPSGGDFAVDAEDEAD